MQVNISVSDEQNQDQSVEVYQDEYEEHLDPQHERVRQMYFQRGKPSVLRKSKDEVYLLDETGRRQRRICGERLSTMPEGYLCLNFAGKGTHHKGVGACEYHDRGSRGRATLYKVLTQMKKNNTLKNKLVEHEDLDEKLDDVSEEIKLEGAIIDYYIEHGVKEDVEGNIDPNDLDRLMYYIKQRTQTKEAHARIKGSTQLEEQTVRSFVDQLFTLLIQYLQQKHFENQEISELLHLITNKVINPMTSDMLDGAKFEQDAKGDRRVKKDYDELR